MPGDDNNKITKFIPGFEVGGVPNPEKLVYVTGNADAQILAKAYEEYTKDGLTTAERTKIEKLDEILKDAAIVITPTGDKATVVQGDGKTFILNGKPTCRGR